MIIYKLRSLTVEVRGCCWNSEGIVVIIIVVIEAMLLLLLLSLTILVLTNRLLSGFFYPGTQRHTVWYSTCRLTLGFKEIRACLVFQFLYFLFSKLLEKKFLKNYIWNQFSKHSFHLICVWLLFSRRENQKLCLAPIFENKFWILWRRQHIVWASQVFNIFTWLLPNLVLSF